MYLKLKICIKFFCLYQQSFRFGPEIAYIAACTLHVLKGVWKQTLIGSTHPGLYHNVHVYTYIYIRTYVLGLGDTIIIIDCYEYCDFL